MPGSGVSVDYMAKNEDADPNEDEPQFPQGFNLEELRKFLENIPGFDPSMLSDSGVLRIDENFVNQLMGAMDKAVTNHTGGVSWNLARDRATEVARKSSKKVPEKDIAATEQAFRVAALWLDEATSFSELQSTPRILTREEWVQATLQVWTELAEPVAGGIAAIIANTVRPEESEELSELINSSRKIIENVGGAIYAMQFGEVIGQLSTEVVSGGDVGIPLFGNKDDSIQAALIPQNLAEFGEGLDIDPEEIRLYLAVRELAHARLFRQARWLNLHVISALREISSGTRINLDFFEEFSGDPSQLDPEELKKAISAGKLLMPKSETQLAALGRLETTLALIEGWVDVVTASATSRLPSADAIAETVRRRRATGGPAESAFATIAGLELRPRRLREAAELWRKISDAVGAERRDELWSHPDLVPGSEDIDDPTFLLSNLLNPDPEPDEVDLALEELLNDEDGEGRPTE